VPVVINGGFSTINYYTQYDCPGSGWTGDGYDPNSLGTCGAPYSASTLAAYYGFTQTFQHPIVMGSYFITLGGEYVDPGLCGTNCPDAAVVAASTAINQNQCAQVAATYPYLGIYWGSCSTTGWCTGQQKYYMNGSVCSGLNIYGTGFCTENEKYYLYNVETTLDSSGGGTWRGFSYTNGQRTDN
jgi:hypothetical protein